jgi:hypothetical protein
MFAQQRQGIGAGSIWRCITVPLALSPLPVLRERARVRVYSARRRLREIIKDPHPNPFPAFQARGQKWNPLPDIPDVASLQHATRRFIHKTTHGSQTLQI